MSVKITNKKVYDAINELNMESIQATRKAIADALGVSVCPRLISAIIFCQDNGYITRGTYEMKNGAFGYCYWINEQTDGE